MGFFELLLIGVGLAMDAFAVAICQGLAMKTLKFGRTVLIAAFFGGFQALMPFIGWLLGTSFAKYIEKLDHWIAFALLLFIGGKMIYEAIRGGEEEKNADNFSLRMLFVLAVATSIDALAVGITFALLPDTNILLSVSVIGVVTFLLSLVGVMIGNRFGARYKNKAELAGGVILCGMGLKILLDGIGVINF